MAKSKENPLVDIGSTTVSAFNIIRNHEENNKKRMILGIDDKPDASPNKVVRVKVYTPQDKQDHKYFHSLSIDKQVEDFMGTAELRCPYDSDLMEYWEPVRNYCAIYGTNKSEADYKILFIGRVRELKQEGYELVIVFQDYGWKFKQTISQSYANDNVLNKNGYKIMKLMFEALKIDSWVISESARNRLKQVGINSDGNLTVNKEEIEEMPDLIERLKSSDPSKFTHKYTVENKLRESKLKNIKNINYTLKYEKPTKVMKNIDSEGGGFSGGNTIYSTPYASAASAAASFGGLADGAAALASGLSGGRSAPADLCSGIANSSVREAMKVIWAYNRGYTNSYASAYNTIVSYASNSPQTYSSGGAAACLNTLQKYCPRKGGDNAAATTKSAADAAAQRSGAAKFVGGIASSLTSRATKVYNSTKSLLGGVVSWGKSVVNSAINFLFH